MQATVVGQASTPHAEVPYQGQPILANVVDAESLHQADQPRWLIYGFGWLLCCFLGPVGPIFWFVLACKHYCKGKEARNDLPEAQLARASLVTALITVLLQVALFVVLIMWLSNLAPSESTSEVPQLIPGSAIALYNTYEKRFLRMNDRDMEASPTWDDPTKPIPYDWSWERFTVVDAGNGQIAWHNSKFNRFVRMSPGGMDASANKAANLLPAEWAWERFTPVNVGQGEIALHNSAQNRYISLFDGVVDYSSIQNVSGIPDSWLGERWQVVQVTPYLKPGSVVALHCTNLNRFLRMNQVNGMADMDRSNIKNADQLPNNWAWERFTVVDGQNGQVALHNAAWNRFVKMNGTDMLASPEMPAADLPVDRTDERFVIVPAGNGEIALHNTAHNSFIRMTSGFNGGVDSAGPVNAQDLPENWWWERFRVVEA